MLKLTVDVNIVLTWLGFQGKPLGVKSIGIFGELVRGNLDVVVPNFLLVELANVLKWRLKRSEKESQEMVKRVAESGMRFVSVGVLEIHELIRLMHKYGLTSYDVQYLFVAQKEECKLVTMDKKLLEVKKWCVGLEGVDLDLLQGRTLKSWTS